MNDWKEEAQACHEATPENWTTLRCAQCGDKFPALKSNIDYGEAYWCPDCRPKLFGKD